MLFLTFHQLLWGCWVTEDSVPWLIFWHTAPTAPCPKPATGRKKSPRASSWIRNCTLNDSPRRQALGARRKGGLGCLVGAQLSSPKIRKCVIERPPVCIWCFFGAILFHKNSGSCQQNWAKNCHEVFRNFVSFSRNKVSRCLVDESIWNPDSSWSWELPRFFSNILDVQSPGWHPASRCCKETWSHLAKRTNMKIYTCKKEGGSSPNPTVFWGEGCEFQGVFSNFPCPVPEIWVGTCGHDDLHGHAARRPSLRCEMR